MVPSRVAFLTIVALLAIAAPAVEALTCRCAHGDTNAAAPRSCCAARDAADRQGGRGGDDPAEPCCCQPRAEALPAGPAAGIPQPPAVPVALFEGFAPPREFATRASAPLLARPRCRDAPDLFALNSLRL